MTDEQSLATVCEITGADTVRGKELLDSCNGDVEQAIALHFAADDFNDGGGPHRDDIDIGSPTTIPDFPMTRTPTGSTGEGGAASSNAPVVAPEVQPSPSSGLFGALRRTFNAVTQAITGIASDDYQEWFTTHYGTPCPEFSRENYTLVMEQARQDNKLIILWLHNAAAGDAENDACCRCFQHESVLNAVSDNFLIFACDSSRFDAAHIAAKLNVRAFPTLVIVKPVSGMYDDPYILEWPLGVFCQPVGRITPTNFVAEDVMLFLLRMVEEAQNSQHMQEVANSARQRQNEEARLLREMQDREYEEALLRDQLREIETREGTTSQTARNEGAGMGERHTAGTAGPSCPSSIPAATQSVPSPSKPSATPPKETPRWKAARRSLAKSFLDRPPIGEDCEKAKISLRFPSGYKSDKVFDANTEAKTLYVWAETIEEQIEINEEQHERGPRDVPEKISIWTPYPPQQIPNSDETLASLGLCPATALNVRFHKE